MPDWTYQTVFRPILFRMPFPKAQAIAFRSMGLLGRNPIGRAAVRLLGHAKPAAALTISKAGLTFPGPCGLGSGVDLKAEAVSATCLFGFGLIEVGPVAVTQTGGFSTETTSWRGPGLAMPSAHATLQRDELATALRRNTFRNGVPVIARLLVDAATTAADLAELGQQFKGLVDGFSIVVPAVSDAVSTKTLIQQCEILRTESTKLFAIVDARGGTSCLQQVELLQQLNVDGIVLEHGIDAAEKRGVLNDEVQRCAVTAVELCALRDSDMLLISSGGVAEPAAGLAILDAGADIVLVDSGFAVSGPGLPKRINAGVLSQRNQLDQIHAATADDEPIPHRSWFWAFLLGLGLTIGGLMVLVIGWTRVLLPYDEEFLGMLRDEVCSINAQLLPFMSHDRVTLAGTMLALGPLYLSLAWFGDRRGMQWARTAVLTGSCLGFLSFFLFLGFGYFDPFHAFISTIFFQLMTLCLRSSVPRAALVEFDTHNTPSWKRALWGQLLMVIQGAAILLGGIIISSFGVTSVFVPEDLEFMQTTRDVLVEANPRLVPLVAHDRASFGGMLMATGVTVLLSSLWGWQRGRRWLWCTLTGSGTIAYVTTIAVHWSVGYTSLRHLLPAYGGLLCLWLAMLLSKEWMFEDASQSNAWRS